MMKHPTAVIVLTNFQRDPSFSARVSPGSDAWRVLIDHFDQRGIGRTVGLLAKLLDAQGETESVDAFIQRMLHTFQELNEDEFLVSEKNLVAATLYNLNSKLSGARANIIAALDARQNGQAAASIPFTQLSTMLIQHQSHTSFHGHHPPGRRHGMHDPQAFNTAVEVAVEEALAARADRSQRNRAPPPCRYCTDAGLPMADRLHWHHDCPLPLPSCPPHQQYQHQYHNQQNPYQQYAPHPSAFRGRGRGQRGRGGRWTRGGRGSTPRDSPSGQPSVSHSSVPRPIGDVASVQSALMSFFDLDGAPSINMADGLRPDYETHVSADDAYVSYMPGYNLRPLVRGIRLVFPPPSLARRSRLPYRLGRLCLTVRHQRPLHQ